MEYKLSSEPVRATIKKTVRTVSPWGYKMLAVIPKTDVVPSR